jgi:predicted PurR-regulated permease PerM
MTEEAAVRTEVRLGRGRLPVPRPSFGVVILGLIVFLYVIREILPPFVIAAAIAYIVFPAVAAVEKRWRAPRLVVVLLFYVALVGLLVGAAYLLVPRFARQVVELRDAGPQIVDQVLTQALGTDRLEIGGQSFTGQELAERISDEIRGRVANPDEVTKLAELALHYLLRLLVFFVALFYLLLDGPAVVRYPLGFFGPRRPGAEAVLARVNAAWGRYVRGQLLLVGLMSLVSYLVLAFVFHLPYALAIGVATGMLEVIPLLGPLLAGALACSVAIAHGGAIQAAWIALTYFVLRQVEDQVVMPVVVGRAVHLTPIVTLFAVLSGERIAGPLGMILAIPLAAAAKILLDVWRAAVETDAAKAAPG